MTDDLDQLLNRAEMRGNLPVWELRPLIERVKEAEECFEECRRTNKLRRQNEVVANTKRNKAEARLRAAEEVVDAVKVSRNSREVDDALQRYVQRYDKAVKGGENPNQLR